MDHLAFSFGAPARNRTSNNGLEVRSYIHLTTGANEGVNKSLLKFKLRVKALYELFIQGQDSNTVTDIVRLSKYIAFRIYL
jgi:hypothetical protein